MYSDIVPVNVQDELLAIRDCETVNGWKVGDLTSIVCRYNEANGSNVTRQDIYSAVGVFVGKSSRTVREFHALAQFFSPESREKYNVLAFDHFREASRLGPEQALVALEWAIKQTDTLGRPATVDAMIAKFQPEEPGAPELPPGVKQNDLEHMFMTVIRQEGLIRSWMAAGYPSQVQSKLESYLTAAVELKEEITQYAAVAERV